MSQGYTFLVEGGNLFSVAGDLVWVLAKHWRWAGRWQTGRSVTAGTSVNLHG